MSVLTNTNIRAWQKHAGLTQASPETAKDLDRVQSLALDLIRCCELEKSGIRDGDGYWHGSDPIGGIIHEIYAWDRQRFANRQEMAVAHVAADNDLPF